MTHPTIQLGDRVRHIAVETAFGTITDLNKNNKTFSVAWANINRTIPGYSEKELVVVFRKKTRLDPKYERLLV